MIHTHFHNAGVDARKAVLTRCPCCGFEVLVEEVEWHLVRCAARLRSAMEKPEVKEGK